MKTYHKLVQGTPEWHAHRNACDNASDAPAMMGVSSYRTRDALLKKVATGEEEVIPPAVQKIFDDGHRFEEIAIPWAEEIIGHELFKPTISLEVDGLKLSSSFDGLTMMEDVTWEHKTLNKKLAINIPNGLIDIMYQIQMEQQLLISGAKRCLFMASNGSKETMVHIWYESNPELRAKIIAGWKQFHVDLENYEAPELIVAPAAEAIESLPALQIMVQGSITNSNLAIYNSSALTYIESINTELKTDSDFANAETAVKFLKKAEVELESVKNQVFSQTSDIEKALNTIKHIQETSRTKRLALEKLVTSQKTVVKNGIINAARENLTIHINALHSELAGQTFSVQADFQTAVKNKRTIESMNNAVSTELANRKAEANEIAGLMRKNLAYYNTAATEHQFLFNDLSNIVRKANDDFILVVDSRITEHTAKENAKAEKLREEMRLEEERKAKEKIEKAEELKRVEAENIKIANQRKQEAAEKELAEEIDAVVVPEKINPSAPKAEEPVESSTAASEKPADTGNEPKKSARTIRKPIPTGDQMVSVLAAHYETSNENIISWLQNIDFMQLAKAS